MAENRKELLIKALEEEKIRMSKHTEDLRDYDESIHFLKTGEYDSSLLDGDYYDDFSILKAAVEDYASLESDYLD